MNTHNKNGDVSAYGFACGLVQRYEKDGIQASLWQEHGVYFVRTHNFNTGRRITDIGTPILGNARTHYGVERLRIRTRYYLPHDNTLGTKFNGTE